MMIEDTPAQHSVYITVYKPWHKDIIFSNRTLFRWYNHPAIWHAADISSLNTSYPIISLKYRETLRWDAVSGTVDAYPAEYWYPKIMGLSLVFIGFMYTCRGKLNSHSWFEPKLQHLGVKAIIVVVKEFKSLFPTNRPNWHAPSGHWFSSGVPWNHQQSHNLTRQRCLLRLQCPESRRLQGEQFFFSKIWNFPSSSSLKQKTIS